MLLLKLCSKHAALLAGSLLVKGKGLVQKRVVFLIATLALFGANSSVVGQTASAVTSVASANPAVIPASGTTTITVQLRDVSNSNLTTGGATVTFLSPSSGSIGTTTDNGDGTYTAVYTASVTTGQITITPRVAGVSFSNTFNIIVSSTYTIDGTSGNNRVRHNFSTNGNLTLSNGFFIDYLIVGGGGGGANTAGGGGAGGGVQVGLFNASNTNYSISVGSGGTAAYPNGTNGGNSSAFGFNAFGGSGGIGLAGGNSGSPQSRTGGNGWTNSPGSDGASGGGGAGAGANGSNGGTNSVGGNGGAGIASTITGTSVTYAGGGGGGSEYNFSGGSSSGSGANGGGNGGLGQNNSNNKGGNASVYGSGGGGGGAFSGPGGTGFQGVVIVRYQGSSLGAVGGTVATGSGSAIGYTLHTFTSGSNFNLSSLVLNNRLGSNLDGVISGSGNLTYSGPGRLTLTANNTYTGQTILTSGSVQVGTNASTGTLGSGTVELQSGISLIYNRSDNVSIANAFSLPGIGSRTLQNDGSGTLTLSGSNSIAGEVATPATLTITGSGDINIEQSISSSSEGISLVKDGNGILTLASNSNGYTGTTTVNAGVLKVTGISGTGAITIKSGAALIGSGTMKGATTIESGATLMSDATNSQLSFDNGLILNGGSNFNWNISNANGILGSDWDHLQINGALSINAASNNKININIWSVLANGTDGEISNFKPTESSYSWTIATATSISGFSADKFNLILTPSNGTNGLMSRYNVDGFSIVQDGNSIKLQYTPPSSQIIDGTDNVSINSTALNFTTSNLSGTLTLGVGFYTDYLIVGAGGGGGSNSSGGGGAGGIRTGTASLTNSNYSITVGTGGTGGTSSANGNNGASSSAFGLTAGGGLGASRTGGSSGTPQSKSGGTGWINSSGDGAGGGGGAGAGGLGANGSSNSVGGRGGIGIASSITGSSVTYAGGGGGGNEYTAGASTAAGVGINGGGNGGRGTTTSSANNAASATNYGSGGGGGGGFNGTGGRGSDGIVVLRYPGSSVGSIGGTVSAGTGTATGYTIHTLTSSGNFNLSGLSLASRLKAVMSGNIIGAGNVVYTGPGLLTLSGTSHNYNGTTSITTGELRVNSNITSSSAVTVSSGATLSGTGTLPATTVSGTHAPGTSPGVQTISGNLTYNGASSINWELISNAIGTRGTDYDGIDVTGNLDFARATTLNLIFNGAGSSVDWTNAFWDTDKTGVNGWKLFELQAGSAVSGLNNVSFSATSSWLDINSTQLRTRNISNGTFALEQVGTAVYLTYRAKMLNSFVITGMPAVVQVNTANTGVSISAVDEDAQTITNFTSTVVYGGTAGITGTSANFTAGQLTGLSLTATSTGNQKTLTATASSITGTATFDVATSLLTGVRYLNGTSGNNVVDSFYSTAGNLTLNQSFFVNYLIVAGGGGGASGGGGGGGAGGLLQGISGPLSSQTYSIVVGPGGSGGAGDNVSGNNGSSSSALGFTAIGGGGGGKPGGSANSGGSGGGAGRAASSPGNGGTATSGQGNNGGTNASVNPSGAGGGGAGGVGGNGGSGNTAGSGGAGLANTITGNPLFYAGGGGGSGFTGAGFTTPGAGGSGGGGAGGSLSTSYFGVDGLSNSGGGGGAGAYTNAAVNGAKGGSGVVIVRYEGQSVSGIGGTETSYVGNGTIGASGVTYRVHTFTSSGNFNLSSVNLSSRLKSTLTQNISGSGSLTYAGPGELKLTANNTYTGTTTVSAGTLIVDGNQSSATGAVSVENGATLKGAGTIGGATTIKSGSTLQPGNEIGSINLSNGLTLQESGNLNWQIDDANGTQGVDWDHTNVTGVLTISSTSTNPFKINLWTLLANGTNGNLSNFSPSTTSIYRWPIFTATSISGFAANKFQINTTSANGTGGFQSATTPTGTFVIEQSGNFLELVYYPPSSQTINGTNYLTESKSYTTNTSTGSLTMGLGFLVDYLVVAGGGSGGGTRWETGSGGGAAIAGGGGSGGEVISNVGGIPLTLNTGSYTITVGAGGNGGAQLVGSSGGSSSIVGTGLTTISALGGGYAGGAGYSGTNGGGSVNQGGAGNISGNAASGRTGGSGVSNSISGTEIKYGGGGSAGGNSTSTGSLVGTDGGGTGGAYGSNTLSGAGYNGGSGSSNRGGGGGGAGATTFTYLNGGTGGSGLITFRYQGEQAGTGGVITSGTGTATGYTIHTFNSSGTFLVPEFTTRLNASLTGTISGTGNFIYSGPGKLVLTATNSYTGTTTVSAGTLQVGEETTTGSIGAGTISVASGATLVFNRTNTLTLGSSNRITGLGTVEQAGTGALDLGGISNNDAGIWKMSSGSITNGTITSGNYNLLEGTVSAILSGTGALTKTGDGTVSLSGDNSYTGTTTISAGTLVVNGNQSGTGDVTVASGATLKGSGTIGGTTTIQNGGTLQPGNNIGTTQFANGLNLEGGGNLNWQVNSTTGAAGSNWSSVNVSGALNINSTSNNKFNINIWSLLSDGSNGGLSNFYPTLDSYSWTILTAGSITGFDATKFQISTEPTNGTNGLVSTYKANGFRIVQDGNSLKLTYSPPTQQTIDGTNSGIEATSYTTNTSANSLTLNLGFFVDYLLVGGGGGGGGTRWERGGSIGGGGGAGGQVLSNIGGSPLLIGANSYTVSVGTGGSGGSSLIGTSGISSSLSGSGVTTISALGGGAAGGGGYDGINRAGNANRGGTGGRGFNAASGRIGGVGFSNTISGTTVQYAGGGAAGGNSINGTAQNGTDGGGNGGLYGANSGSGSSYNGSAGTANLGSGGGGAGGTTFTYLNGGAGGSGVALIRYEGPTVGSIGGNVTSFTGDGTIGKNGVLYQVHRFNASGNFNMSGVSLNTRLLATLSGNIIGNGSLIYEGPGRLALTGTAHTYIGTTSITTGELRVNSNITTSSGVTVSSGATLSGTGTLPSTTVSGTHAPGTSPGIQSIAGNLTYAAGSAINMEIISNAIGIRGTDYDGVNITGDLTFNATTTMNLVFNGTGSAVDWSETFWKYSRTGANGWKLFEVSGNVSGLSNVTVTLPSAATDLQGDVLSTVRNGSTVSFGLTQIGTGIYLSYTVTSTPITWTGTTNTNWNTATNWNPNGIPAEGNAIMIASTANAPNFTGTGTYTQLTVNSGATFSLAASSTFSVLGNVVNNGTVSGSGTLELSGATAQEISGAGTVNNIKINNTSGGVAIASGTNKMYVTGVYTPTSGVLTTNGNLVFRSTATQEGVVGTAGISGTCTTEPISGDVTVEKYIPAKRAFRFLTPGVTTSTNINANWQEGANLSTQNPNPGYGTHITGTGGSTNGFDATITNNSSLFTFDVFANNWVAEANTNSNTNVLRRGEAYRLMVRGSRLVDLNNNAATASVTTLRTTGALSVCASMSYTTSSTVPLSSASGGFSLIGNPYWSVIDWTAIANASSNIEPTLYYWDPTINGQNNRGAYVSFNASSNLNSLPLQSNLNRYIQPGQAVFVQNTVGVNGTTVLPSITISQSHVVGSSGNKTLIFGKNNLSAGGELGVDDQQRVRGAVSNKMEKIYVTLNIKNRVGQGAADGFVVAYGKGFTDLMGREDAAKFSNLDENIAAVHGGVQQSILGLQLLDASKFKSDTIPVSMWNLAAGEYVMQVKLDSEVDPGREVMVLNRTTGQQFRVDNKLGLDLSFLNATGNRTKDDLVIVVNSRKITPAPRSRSQLVIYPNPTSNGLVELVVPNVGGKLSFGNAMARIEIVDLQGQVVLVSEVILDAVGRASLDAGSIGAGGYVVRVYVGNQVFTSKLLKQ